MDVERWCRVRRGTDLDETPFDLDEHGYLETPSLLSFRPQQVDKLVSPLVLSECTSFALLGEPGSGKTFVLNNLREFWTERLGPDRVSHINAMDLTEARYEAMLGSLLAALPPTSNEQGSNQEAVDRVVVVDQLDESPALQSLAALLEESLQHRHRAGLRLFVACRQMNYPPELHTRLRNLLTFAAAELAPLTRSQAIALADAHGVSGQVLTGRAAFRGVAALASVPLTLQMLCAMFEDSDDLVGSPIEIFRRAVTLFADRRSEPRMSVVVSLGRNQRMAISQRLAAHLLLTGRRNFLTGTDRQPRPTDLDLGDAAGGIETTTTGQFEVTQQLVRDTLGCALFASAGEGRTTFRHSSIAAFLAAEYLLRRNVPESQLRQLLLIEQHYGDTWQSIPTPLRETAAWLIALAPEQHTWLLAADPLGLTAYSALIDSDTARATLAAELIRSADDAYLSDSWWRRRGSFRLEHPGLADQVLAALKEPPVDGWRSRARLQLLLELAETAADPALADTLHDIAFDETQDAHIRRLAVDAFAACRPERISDLTVLLDRLQDEHDSVEPDPDDNLRGALLRTLWPNHLSPAALVSQMRPRRNANLYGSYAIFAAQLAARAASDEQVIDVVTTLAAGVPQAEEHAEPDADVAVDNSQPSREFVLSFLSRAIAGPRFDDLLPSIARILTPMLANSSSLDIPEALDEARSELSADLAAARRRLLAEALAEASNAEPDWAAHTIMSAWRGRSAIHPSNIEGITPRTTLLDTADFSWLATRADRLLDHDHRRALILAELAGTVLDTGNTDDYSQAYDLFQRIGEESWRIASPFVPISVDSWPARAWHRERQTEAAEPWDGAGEFAASAQQLLTDIDAGQSSLFGELAYTLQFDPRTGQGRHLSFDDDLLSYPGVPVLGTDGAARLRAAAQRYLTHEHDQRSTWLGTDTLLRSAWAGYLALCILDRDDEAHPTTPWHNWVGAVLWYHAESGSDAEQRHNRLMLAAAQAAPEAFADAVHLMIKNTLEHGQMIYDISTIPAQAHPEIGPRLLRTLRSVGDSIAGRPGEFAVQPQDGLEANAVQLWRELATVLLNADVVGSVEEIRAALAFAAGVAPSPLAVAAATVLMSKVPARAWPTIRDQIETNATTGQPIVYALAEHAYYGVNFAAFDDDHLVEFYLWLRALLPVTQDVTVQGVHWVGRHEQAQRLRGQTLETLSQRATPRMLELLRAAIASEDAIELVSAERRVRNRLAETSWDAPGVDDLMQMLSDPARRLVRTDNELASLLIETLRDIAQRVSAHGELLWDRVPTAVAAACKDRLEGLHTSDAESSKNLWSPKTEGALSAYLANQLDLRLRERQVVVNREVLVKPTDVYGSGHRVDLLVQVLLQNSVICAVPIEIKGHWNRDVQTSLTTQLADRYLPDIGTRAGIYLVGWWSLAHWNLKEPRRAEAAKWSAVQLDSVLSADAAAISRTRAVSVLPFVLKVSRPARINPDAAE